MLHQRLHDPSLSATESLFLDALAPVFTELEEAAQDDLYVEGTARLLSAERFADISELNALMEMLERRVTLLGVLRTALTDATCSSASGPRTRARRCARSRWSRQLRAPQRSLGTVSVIGPVRMDYGQAIRAVREAALQLSSYIADVYDERWERTRD